MCREVRRAGYFAHHPVNDWLWSRPVNSASFRGSVARIAPNQDVASDSASSHSISRKSPFPRSPVRSRGLPPATRRRIVVHDPCGSLAADHAVVHRMRGIAVDVADAAVLQVHPDAAPARAHVARRHRRPCKRRPVWGGVDHLHRMRESSPSNPWRLGIWQDQLLPIRGKQQASPRRAIKRREVPTAGD